MDGKMRSVLAIDLGASSGRGIVFESDASCVRYFEVHRFDNNCIDVDGTLRWDLDMLYSNIVTCISKCREQGVKIDSIGIDTWGVDYGVVDAKGNIKAQPYCYRDTRTLGAIDNEELFAKREMYDMAGISLNEFNTSYQLIAEQKTGGISKGDSILYMPYLLAYMLTGKMSSDISMASTSAIYGKNGYDKTFLDAIGIDESNFPKVDKVGSLIGNVKRDILDVIGIDYDIPVLVTCGHDTASAIITVMEENKSPLYLSSGTWSLFGTILDEPVINDVTFSENYTNERGFMDKVTLLKNIMGMWIIQECRREWNKNANLSWQDIQDASKVSTPFKAFINVEDGIFNAPRGMDSRIVGYVKTTQGVDISGVGEIARCVYDSLAMEYRYSLEGLMKITGKTYDTLYIIGGGTKNETLNQLVADSLGIKVIGGCVEATAIGNALSQFYGLGVLKDIEQIHELANLCYEPKTFYPTDNRKLWYEMYAKYLSLKK